MYKATMKLVDTMSIPSTTISEYVSLPYGTIGQASQLVVVYTLCSVRQMSLEPSSTNPATTWGMGCAPLDYAHFRLIDA